MQQNRTMKVGLGQLRFQFKSKHCQNWGKPRNLLTGTLPLLCHFVVY